MIAEASRPGHFDAHDPRSIAEIVPGNYLAVASPAEYMRRAALEATLRQQLIELHIEAPAAVTDLDMSVPKRLGFYTLDSVESSVVLIGDGVADAAMDLLRTPAARRPHVYTAMGRQALAAA